jgi:hypothetical protein
MNRTIETPLLEKEVDLKQETCGERILHFLTENFSVAFYRAGL